VSRGWVRSILGDSTIEMTRCVVSPWASKRIVPVAPPRPEVAASIAKTVGRGGRLPPDAVIARSIAS
jgi:hypothetical protein